MSGGISRGRHRDHHDEEHEEHTNHEAWVIPYADMLTLLMALFLVMFAIGRTDNDKLNLAAKSFRDEFGGGDAVIDLGDPPGGGGPLQAGGASVLNGAGPAPLRTDVDVGTPMPSVITPADEPITPPKVIVIPDVALDPDESDDQIEAGAPSPDIETIEPDFGDPLTKVEATVRARAEGTGLIDSIGLRREERGLVVTIVTDEVLFEEARADVKPVGRQILAVVADALSELPNAVIIEGHTDSRPIHTARYPSNWELSTARSVSVLRYMVDELDFPIGRISASGYADTHPIDTGASPEALARNRRVEIVVRSTT